MSFALLEIAFVPEVGLIFLSPPLTETLTRYIIGHHDGDPSVGLTRSKRRGGSEGAMPTGLRRQSRENEVAAEEAAKEEREREADLTFMEGLTEEEKEDLQYAALRIQTQYVTPPTHAEWRVRTVVPMRSPCAAPCGVVTRCSETGATRNATWVGGQVSAAARPVRRPTAAAGAGDEAAGAEEGAPDSAVQDEACPRAREDPPHAPGPWLSLSLSLSALL